MNRQAVASVVAWSLAALILAAAVAKAASPGVFADSLADAGLAGFAHPVWVGALVFAEAAAGLALALRPWRTIGAWAAAGLGLVFVGFHLWSWVAGTRTVACACFGGYWEAGPVASQARAVCCAAAGVWLATRKRAGRLC